MNAPNNTRDAVRSGVGGVCEMPTCTVDPLTVEQALKWYDESEATRNREWRRFMALRDAAEQAMKFGELGALGDVLHALDDPRWIPSAGAEPGADVIERDSESGAGSQNAELCDAAPPAASNNTKTVNGAAQVRCSGVFRRF